jgi:23S rRNA pseudouridine1911/1915/1917 synthase
MNILFEDYYLLAVEKPAGLSTESGLASHPSAETWALRYLTESRRESALSKRLKPTPYLRVVHRLDRAASGILLMAKTKQALTGLMEQFEARKVEKRYFAVVAKQPPAANLQLVHWLKKDDTGKRALVADKQWSDSQQAKLVYTLRGRHGKGWLLEVELQTGRFHQIRAQLAHVGLPIIGDKLYGGKAWQENAIQLHACKLRFDHPKSGETMVLESALPADW